MKKISLMMLMVVSILPVASLSASEQANTKQPEVSQELNQEQNVVINANNFVVNQGQTLDATTAIQLAGANVDNVATDLVVNERQLQAINDNQDGGFFTLTFSCGETNKVVSVVKSGATVVGNDKVFITARDVTYTQEVFNNIVNHNDVTQIIADATAQAINVNTGAIDTAFNVAFNNNQVTFTKDGVAKTINVVVDNNIAQTREAAPAAETVTLSAENKVLYQDEAQNQIKTVDDLKTVLGLTSTPDKNTEVTVEAGSNFNKIKNGAISYDGYDITFNYADQSVTKKLYIVDKENCAVSKDQKTFIRLFDTYVQTYKWTYQNLAGPDRKPKHGSETPDIKTVDDVYNVSYALVVSDGQVVNYPNQTTTITGFDAIQASVGKASDVKVDLSYTLANGEKLNLTKTMHILLCDYQKYVPDEMGGEFRAGDNATKDHLGKLSLKIPTTRFATSEIVQLLNVPGGLPNKLIETYQPQFEYRGKVYNEAIVPVISDTVKQSIVEGKISNLGYPVQFIATVPDTNCPDGYAETTGVLKVYLGQGETTINVIANNYVDKQADASTSKADILKKLNPVAYYNGQQVTDITITIENESQLQQKVIGDYPVTITAKSGDKESSVHYTYSIVSNDSLVTPDHLGYIYTEKQNIGRLQSDVINKINTKEDILELLGITAKYDGVDRQVDIRVVTGNFYDIKEGELGSYQYEVQLSGPQSPDYLVGTRIFTIFDSQTTASNGYAIRADDISKHVSELPLTAEQVLELSHAKAWKIDGTNNNVPIKVDEAQLNAIVAIGDYPLTLMTDEKQAITRAGDAAAQPGTLSINVHVYGDPEQPVAPQAPTPVVNEQPAPQIPTGVKNAAISLALAVVIASVALVLVKRNRK